MGLNLDNLPQRDFYSIEQIADCWDCSIDDIYHFIQVQKSLRLGLNPKDISNDIQTVYIDDDRDLIESVVKAFKQKLPVPSNYFKYGVRLQAKDIGAQHYDKLVKYTSNRSKRIKTWKESDFIYEDIANIQRAEQFFEHNVPIYQGGITWVDEEYDEKLGVDYFDPRSSHEYYVTGLDFEGDRYLLVKINNKKEEIILRPLLKTNFSTIPREEKERFEKESGMSESHKDATENPTGLHPLSIFRSMDNLKFNKIKIKLDIDNQIARIEVKGKETIAPYNSLGLVNKNNSKNNAQGNLLEKIARRAYDPTTIMGTSTMGRLSIALRRAFNLLDDQPFSRGKPIFKLSIPKDKEAKFKADSTISGYKEGMEGKLWESENDTQKSTYGHDTEAWAKDHDSDYNPDDPMWSERD